MSVEGAMSLPGIGDTREYVRHTWFGGLKARLAMRPRGLAQKISRLRQVVANLSIDDAMTKEAAARLRGPIKRSRARIELMQAMQPWERGGCRVQKKSRSTRQRQAVERTDEEA
jgi:hypothetical protein